MPAATGEKEFQFLPVYCAHWQSLKYATKSIIIKSIIFQLHIYFYIPPDGRSRIFFYQVTRCRFAENDNLQSQYWFQAIYEQRQVLKFVGGVV